MTIWEEEDNLDETFRVGKEEGLALPERPKVSVVLSENEVSGFLAAQPRTP